MKLPAPPRPASGQLYLGRVARVRADGRVDVNVRILTTTRLYTSLRIVEGPWTPSLASEAASAGTAHTHGAGVDLAAGDQVLVAPIEARLGELVVLGRLRP